MAMTRLEAKAIRARRAIAAQTTALEEHLWRGIRAIPGEGGHFHRQVVIGPYLADFVSHRLRLVIEVDGAQHARPEQQAKDAGRDRWLADRGYDVLRFANSAVRADAAAVLEAIRAAVDSRRHLPPGAEPARREIAGKRRPRPKPGTS
ncbi:MAG: endonuclease domain-containing protein [Aurantimonas endophytica]|uniref:endonuclease domain-containing protein n=1 Tax=Aurantimonas endophytica TaxID=1522175 RepID=UPI0030032C7C